MNMTRFILPAMLLALAMAGCKTTYQWTSKVPQELRTVSVPTFRNESDVTELGPVATRQLLREFQREGTFKIRDVGDAAIEVQGVIVNTSASRLAGDRMSNGRHFSSRLTIVAKVSVIDKRRGQVVVDNKKYTAYTVYDDTPSDTLTSRRDASARAADDLARQIVDDIVAYPW